MKNLSLNILNILKVLFLFLITLSLIFIIVSQIKAELYLAEAKSRYNVYQGERINYLPYLVYEIMNKYNGKYQDFQKNARIPYHIKGYYANYTFNLNFGGYFAYCYYSLEELENHSKGPSNLVPSNN